MKDDKNALLYLDSFNENTMFDFEPNNKSHYVSEVSGFKMYHKIEKKLYEGVSQFEIDSDTECESLEYDDYYVLSEDSDTGEIIGFRNLY